VRTGGSIQGWYGDNFLPALLPAAHAAGLQVIAWDFPFLSDPLRDVRRADKAITSRFGGERIDGFSPDIETISEGTFDTARRVRVYLSRVRQLAGTLPEWQDMPLTWLAIAGLVCTIIGFIVMFFTQSQGYGGLFAP